VPASSPNRKRRNSYHHGNLREALIGQAVETIRRGGVEALTLRAVGAGLRVSRTALYRHFFGGFIAKSDSDPELQREATAAFRVLLDAIVELQQAGKFDRDDPELLARFVWSTVHGIAMLALDGLLQSADTVTSLALKRLRTGIEAR
jgi:hypothetical protein